MHTGYLVAPAVSRVAPLLGTTNRGTPTVARDRRRPMLEAFGRPANNLSLPPPPHTGRPDHPSTGPASQVDHRCASRRR